VAFHRNALQFNGLPKTISLFSNRSDRIWNNARCRGCPGIARHKDQKGFTAVANTGSQTPEEEIDAYSSAREFAKTKENFADSISEPDLEEQIKAQKAFADASPGRKFVSQSSRN